MLTLVRGSRQQGAHLHSLEHVGDRASATLSVDGIDHVMSHRVVDGEPADGYEPFLVAATPIVMARASDLTVDGEVSPRLLNGLRGAQRILNDWYGPDLAQVEIDAQPATAGREPEGRGVACFFSAGLDSFYSVVTNRERLDALVFVHGFDVWLDDLEHRERVARLVRRAADALELPLIEVETDVRAIARPYTQWGEQYHGALLASIGLALAPRFREVLIPGSAPETLLHPWGSHPDLDPLWSSDAVEFIHDGAVTRSEKLALLSDSAVTLEHLRVCFQLGAVRVNCGECEKCMRTMVGLRIEGALERCATLPDEVPLRRLARLPLGADYLIQRAGETLTAAEAAGDAELAAALRRMIRDGPRRAAAIDARKRRRRELKRRRRRAVRRLRRALRGA
jgi:hypothetical protein